MSRVVHHRKRCERVIDLSGVTQISDADSRLCADYMILLPADRERIDRTIARAKREIMRRRDPLLAAQRESEVQ